ncbi:NAD-dependent epimerase/dehydratase family protein [Spirosoma koreense]
MNGRILIAGASGAVGQRLCRLLVSDGWELMGTTRFAQKTDTLRALGVEPIVVDVFDIDRLNHLVAKVSPTVIIHQLTDLPPALDPVRMPEALVRNAHIREVGTRNLIAAAVQAGGVRRIVAQSISFAYAPGLLPYREESRLNASARGVIQLEEQVLNAPFTGLVLRYGRFYGPGTGFEEPASGGAVHVDAAADAARKAISQGAKGIYNVAEEDGTVDSSKAQNDLNWNPAFRIE